MTGFLSVAAFFFSLALDIPRLDDNQNSSAFVSDFVASARSSSGPYTPNL